MPVPVRVWPRTIAPEPTAVTVRTPCASVSVVEATVWPGGLT